MKYIFISILLTFIFSCAMDSRKEDSIKLIEQISSFKEKNGRYPYSLGEIGVKEDEAGPIYYQLTDDSTNYRLWYGLGLGDSEEYKSETDTWYSPDNTNSVSK
ncbi:MAG: hypothetical protein KDD41_03665 [Flavobacteriales bacterium]|nr:hypothetical protein [Flavobacteriales bacterium]